MTCCTMGEGISCQREMHSNGMGIHRNAVRDVDEKTDKAAALQKVSPAMRASQELLCTGTSQVVPAGFR
jgi:hypothetical protein